MADENKKAENSWLIRWIAGSLSAGIGGTFILFTYMNSHFASADDVEKHEAHPNPHTGTVSKERYNADMKYLRDQLTALNSKMDRVLEKRK